MSFQQQTEHDEKLIQDGMDVLRKTFDGYVSRDAEKYLALKKKVAKLEAKVKGKDSTILTLNNEIRRLNKEITKLQRLSIILFYFS